MRANIARRCLALAFSLLITCPSIAVAANEPLPVVTPVILAYSAYKKEVTSPTVAINRHGVAVAAWLDEDGRVLAARYQPGGGWSAPKQLGNGDSRRAYLLRAGVDAQGDAIIVWRTAKPSELGTSRFTSQSGWADAQVHTLDEQKLAENGDSWNLAVGEKGDAMLLYKVENEAALWAKRFTPDKGWESAQAVSAPGFISSSNVFVDSQGTATAVWAAYGGGPDWQARLWQSRYSAGASWSLPRKIHELDKSEPWGSPILISGNSHGALAIMWAQGGQQVGDSKRSEREVFTLTISAQQDASAPVKIDSPGAQKRLVIALPLALRLTNDDRILAAWWFSDPEQSGVATNCFAPLIAWRGAQWYERPASEPLIMPRPKPPPAPGKGRNIPAPLSVTPDIKPAKRSTSEPCAPSLAGSAIMTLEDTSFFGQAKLAIHSASGRAMLVWRVQRGNQQQYIRALELPEEEPYTRSDKPKGDAPQPLTQTEKNK
jgi:hypothetical protein